MTKQELLAGGVEKVSQAAKRFGIDKNTIYHWIQEERIPYLHVNGVYRIPSLAIDEMLLAGLNAGCAHADE